jgi:hypothetical protein
MTFFDRRLGGFLLRPPSPPEGRKYSVYTRQLTPLSPGGSQTLFTFPANSEIFYAELFIIGGDAQLDLFVNPNIAGQSFGVTLSEEANASHGHFNAVPFILSRYPVLSSTTPSYFWSVIYDPTYAIPLFQDWTLKLTNITPEDIYYQYLIALVESESG